MGKKVSARSQVAWTPAMIPPKVLAALVAGKTALVSASTTLLPLVALATGTWIALLMAGSTMVNASTPNTTMIAVLAAVMAGKTALVSASTTTPLVALLAAP